MESSDAKLIEQTLSGDTNAFGALVKKYQGAVYGLAFHITGSFPDAEDLAQESFIKAYEKLTTLRDPNKFAGWVKTITTNICNDWLRRQCALKGENKRNRCEPKARGDCFVPRNSPRNSVSCCISETTPMPDDEIESEELRQIVLSSINALPEKHRLVVTLHYMDGLSTKEISEFLGIPDGTVESRLHRAKTQLRENIALIESALSRQRLGTDFAQKLMDEANRLASEDQEYRPREWDLRHAIQLYQRVVDSWPDSEYAVNAKNLIGMNYVRLGELDRAIEVYENALREDRENMTCRYYLGKAYHERGDYAKALLQYELIMEYNKQLDKTVQIDEKSEQHLRIAWFNSALCCEKLGKVTAARATYEDFLKRFTKGELAICAMVALKRLTYRKDLSTDELREIQRLMERAYYFFLRKAYPMAIKTCQLVIHRFPPIIYVAEAQTIMGKCYQQMGETEKTVETFKKELTHYAQIGSRCRLAQAYEAHGDVTHALEDYARALAEYQIIIRHYPDARPSDLRRAWRGSGNCYKKLGRLDEAKAAYNAAMEIKGDDIYNA